MYGTKWYDKYRAEFAVKTLFRDRSCPTIAGIGPSCFTGTRSYKLGWGNRAIPRRSTALLVWDPLLWMTRSRSHYMIEVPAGTQTLLNLRTTVEQQCVASRPTWLPSL